MKALAPWLLLMTRPVLAETTLVLNFLLIVGALNAFVANEAGGEIFELPPVFMAERYAGNPIIRHGGGGWKDSQVQEPCIVEDPEDPSRLIMFFAAMAAPVAHGVMSVGVATASKDDPYTWHEHPDNPLMQPGAAGAWDDRWIRLDAVVPLSGGQFRIYYTGFGIGANVEQIGTALCTKRGDTFDFERDPANPILSPSGDERVVSQAAVIRDGGRWYMYYSYRTPEKTLPGVRLAVSDDGVQFAKTGKEVLSLGPAGAFDSRFIEWHQVQKVADTLVMLYEANNGTNWSIGMATSTDPQATFTKSAHNPVFERSGVPGAFDEDHVATPAMYCINGRWLLFYQGAKQPHPGEFAYSFSNWDMGIAELTAR